jgi:glycosyltransferase involved in cell wall biosynthesis
MARILWHSAAPYCATGYGQQTDLFTQRLAQAGHEVEMSAHYGLEGRTIKWRGIPVRPGANDYGNYLLPRYLEQYEPDLLITLLDVHVLDAELLKGTPVASWLPVDHAPLGCQIEEWFEKSDAIPIAMSRHGERQLQEAGLDCLYVPHGIETDVFRPHDRAAARERFDLPQDAFLIGMVAANGDSSPSRKAWPEALRAYHRFKQTHPDALLYVHTSLTGHAGGGAGVNIAWLCERIGLGPDDLRGTPQLTYDTDGVAPEQLAILYSAFDVLLSPSYGEGFGLAPLEAQACGVPVIVSDFSAQPELCGAGWQVSGEPWWVGSYRAWWQQPSVDGIVDALEQAYEARGDAGLSAQARAFAETYDADRVFAEYWVPALARLLPGTSRVVRPNREQRRALAKAGAAA